MALRILDLLPFVLFLIGDPGLNGFTKTPPPLTVHSPIVMLYGPWKFHLGDDPSWSDPAYNDSGWESLDLTPPPGAHDSDVGLPGYVPGWAARGHPGYIGYAWYRLRVFSVTPKDQRLALTGPPAVDSAYQLFFNGKLLGGCGDFSGRTPVAFSIQPRFYALPSGIHAAQSSLLAFRVWMGSWALGSPDAGGIHIAPALGPTDGIRLLFQKQWRQTFRGYVVEVIEALAFLILAFWVGTLVCFETLKDASPWLVGALVLTAFYRANQALFFWAQLESVHAFELLNVVLLVPLCPAAWILGWRNWFGLQDARWIKSAVIALVLVNILGQFFSRSWFHGLLPHWTALVAHSTIIWARYSFLALTVVILFHALRKCSSESWFSVPAFLLITVGQFSQELSNVGVRSIWFPFGTGVSRTQFAYALFDLVFIFLLLSRSRPPAFRKAGSR